MTKGFEIPVYSRELVSPLKFVEFWSAQWSAKDRDQDRKNYEPYIGEPLTCASLKALFTWKNQTNLSQNKQKTVERFIYRLPELRCLSKDTDPKTFLETFAQGGAIWRIFLLHCWSHSCGTRKYPIYDQHVHRAMSYICGGLREEIDGWKDSEKIGVYLGRYIRFFDHFRDEHPQKVDQALMVFGRFIKAYRFDYRSDNDC
jgi:hypothetical protein